MWVWRCAALWIRLSTRLPVFGAASISLAEEKEAIVFWLPCIICSFEGFSNLAHTPESGHRHRKSGYVNNHSQNMVEYVICYCFFFFFSFRVGPCKRFERWWKWWAHTIETRTRYSVSALTRKSSARAVASYSSKYGTLYSVGDKHTKT